MRRRVLLFAAGLPLLARCASPPAELYTLAAVPGAPRPIGAHSVELRRIAIAGYLDRPEIVRSAADFRLRVNDQQRWGEPFGGMIERVFTEDLVQRLPGSSVYAEAGAITVRPDLVLEIDVQRFDLDASGAVVLLAQVAIRHDSGDRAGAASTLRLAVTPADSTTTHLVAAMSAALGQLADEVAMRLGAA